MPTGLDQKPEIKQPLSKGRRLLPVLLLCCGLAAALCLWAVASARQSNAGPVPAPPPAPETPPASEPPRPTAPPEETVSAAPLYDFSQPAPEDGEAEEDYFSDAVFLGDSRTDGLRLYSGIRPGGVIYHNGLMVFEAADRENKCIKGADGQKHAVLYLQAIIPVNEEVAKKYDGRAYVTNAKITEYNTLLRQLAEEKQVVYLDLASALAGEDGVLPAEGTTDGVHFRREWYQKWYAYLRTHTVDAQTYWGSLSDPVS